MKAEIHPGYDKKRIMLGETIPLRTPFTVFINPSTICNFKCNYCTHGKSQKELDEIGFVQKNMSYELFLEVADQLTDFPDKFKLIYFYGNGEPLCNPRLPEMIEHLKRSNIAEKLEFFTNGSLLTNEKSRALIDAGLTKIKISIQGLTTQKYKDVAAIDCDFDELVEKVKYFYEYRKDCKVYIKIMDIGLSDNDKERFYKVFGDISDEIFIEHMTYTQRTMGSYDGLIKEKVNLYGEPLVVSDVCPFPFYIIRIGVNGEINPCFEEIFDKQINIKKVSLYDYWNSDLLRRFQIMQLRKERTKHITCNGCSCTVSTAKPEDIIDNYAEQILKRMGEN